ncbi:SPOR domain-containing protein [Aureispira sp. CCB-E]|uniref:HU domain-containing protein n=1 Tax=Aureispira sp. CCB-E TaxID=3051121 RepID=UPI0028695186|nr:SPOR domain-containing protein [Aureispira sp. CCB-E]WMX12450.1 SPOR domain-containing protein [Aureispira sp. CCB-E]
MDLSYHIEELLFSNDCVIIPTIGGFIVNYASASIDFVEQRLLPPQKVVSFNPKLVNNDGLLANHIAQKEHLTYKQATQKVEAFSRQIEVDLFNNKIVHFENIGKLYFNSDSKLEFVPADTNFLKDAYGLPSLACTPILRNKDYLSKQDIPEHLVPIKRKQKAGILSIVAQPKVIAIAAVFIFALSTPFIYRAIVGASSTNPPTTIASNNNTSTQDTNNSSQASLIPSIGSNPTATQPEVEETPVDTIVEKVIEELPEIDKNAEDYVIVLGAFGKKRNADRLAKKLEKDNYLPEVTVKNGLNRVGVQITCTPEELKLHLDFLQENYNKKAWVVE